MKNYKLEVGKTYEVRHPNKVREMGYGIHYRVLRLVKEGELEFFDVVDINDKEDISAYYTNGVLYSSDGGGSFDLVKEIG